MNGRGAISTTEAARLERDGAPAPGRTIKAWGKADNERWERALQNRAYVDAVVVWRDGDAWVRNGPSSIIGWRGGCQWVQVRSKRGPRPGERVLPPAHGGPVPNGDARSDPTR